MAVIHDRDALGAAPATGDILFVSDISDTTDSASGTDKKMTVANLFTSPALTTPDLGTPSAGNLSNCTAYTGDSSLVTTGALNSGSITTGFGNIDNGSSTITTTGDITGGGILVTGDTASGDTAALGYTATEGLILTGQGSTNDVTIKNDADATVLGVPTGTVHLNMAASSQLQVNGTAILSDSAGTMTLSNVDALDATTETTIESAIDTLSNLTTVGTISSGTWEATTIAVDQGGTGQTTYTDGQLLIGNSTGNTLAKATLTEGEGIDITNGSGTITILAEDASTTNKGVSELATTAEIDTGTDTARTITPDALAGSYAGTKAVVVQVVEDATDTATGDGKGHMFIPTSVGGMDLVGVHAYVETAGTTNTTDIQIHNETQAADMLSTKITIDSTETSSRTAATAPVIDTANDDVAAGDKIRFDIDAVSTTAAKGLWVEMEFRLP